MISTEMLIVMLVFLAYVGVWYLYMSNFMQSVESATDRLESGAYADEIQHKVNIMCIGEGSTSAEFKNPVDISGNGRVISVNNMTRDVACDVDVRIGGKTKKANIRKDAQNNAVVID
ncbi:MAG: hypothetical protein QXS93_01325 [Candidatus Micrarchaeia archaeon]